MNAVNARKSGMGCELALAGLVVLAMGAPWAVALYWRYICWAWRMAAGN